MWGFLGWKVNLISFPTSTHGPSYLLGIKSYSYFFWWSELVVRSDLVLFWVRSGALSSYVHLSTINVEHLGSITSLEVIKAQLVRNKFTCSCSFLARRLVSGPWFVSLMLDGEFLTFKVSCTVGMSSSLLRWVYCLVVVNKLVSCVIRVTRRSIYPYYTPLSAEMAMP